MAEKSDLLEIKRNIETCIGEKVQLKSNKGRKRTFIREGVIENTYPSIFTIKFENEYDMTRRVSYSYTDVLTNAVELIVCRNNRRIQVS
ncbi:MAG TPA: Veg family protein [Clostridiales bacterium]|nr:Veg family protein [Clostridiales bacterium]